MSSSEFANDKKPEEAAARKNEDEKSKKLPRLPWGHLVLVGLYLLIGGSLLLFDHLTSEQVRIARSLGTADELLGKSMGAASSTEKLIEAAEHYLEVLSLDPHLELPQRRMDIINKRLDQRRESLPEELARKHAALSGRARMEQAQERKGLWGGMPVTPSERFQLREHRNRVKRNSYLFFGGLVALLGWVFIRTTSRRMKNDRSQPPINNRS